MICSSCAVVGDCSCNHRILVAVVLAFVALNSLKGFSLSQAEILNAQPKFNRHKPQPLSPSRSACGTLSAPFRSQIENNRLEPFTSLVNGKNAPNPKP